MYAPQNFTIFLRENQDLSFVVRVLEDVCAMLDNFCICTAVMHCHTCQKIFHRQPTDSNVSCLRSKQRYGERQT